MVRQAFYFTGEKLLKTTGNQSKEQESLDNLISEMYSTNDNSDTYNQFKNS